MLVTEILLDELGATLPPLHSQEGIRDPIVHLKFAGSGWIWYVTEGSPVDDDFIFFGFVLGPEEEWGEFSLSELTACARSGVPIARDVHFKPLCALVKSCRGNDKPSMKGKLAVVGLSVGGVVGFSTPA